MNFINFSFLKKNMFSKDQEKALELFEKGYNFLLTGAGGSGKSFLIKYIYEMSWKNVYVTAMTGCAAILLDCNAQTLHSWAGIGIGIKDVDMTVKRIMKNNKLKKRWKTVDVLIIDECSMLGAKLFDDLNQLAKKIRKNDKPFGGIQIILSGDFCQLPPIDDNYTFQSESWKECIQHIVDLKTIFRQKDEEFQTFLNKIRFGQWDQDVKNILEKRMLQSTENSTKLFPTRNGVDRINDSKLFEITTEEKTYTCKYSTDDTMLQEKMLKKFTYKESLTLKIGSKVMLIANLDIPGGLVNGSQGIVVSLGTDYVIVEFLNGKTVNIAPHEWDYQDDDDKKISVQMIPLILCWAISIHKCQGMTLDEIEVDIGNQIFEYGQVYTALSRVKTIEGLHVKKFNIDKIQIHPVVKEFYDSI